MLGIRLAALPRPHRFLAHTPPPSVNHPLLSLSAMSRMLLTGLFAASAVVLFSLPGLDIAVRVHAPGPFSIAIVVRGPGSSL